jgi:hypothetical protein
MRNNEWEVRNKQSQYGTVTGKCKMELEAQNKVSFEPQYCPGVDSASNRNDYQKSSLRGKPRPVRKAENLTTIYESYLETLGSSASQNSVGLHGQ